MLPREKLIQCFKCKNNLACWGLLEDIPIGKNENAYSIPTQALTFLISKNMENEKFSIKQQFGMFCATFLQVLRHDEKSDLREVSECVSMLCALSNTSGDSWLCPGECEGVDEKFVYEEK